MADDAVAQRGQNTEGAPANGITEPPATVPTPDPTGTTSQAAPPPAQPPATTGKLFTQEELNRYLADERKKERGKFADYDDLKTKAAKLAEIEQANLTEAEKLQKQLDDARQAIARAEQARLDALETVKTSTIRAAVVSKAAELNFENPEDAYSLLDKTGLSISDAGQVEGVETALKSLAEQKKYLIKQQQGRPLEPFNPAGSGQQLQESDAARRARIYGSGGSMFDTGWAEQHGGGVVWPKGEPTE